jgi:hypothetical protein
MIKAKIESITIEIIPDECPDLSFLGQYTDEFTDGCIKRQNVTNREYKFFKPSTSYNEHWESLHKSGHSKSDCDLLARKYIKQDFDRMESYNNCNWQMIGIRAKAEVSYPIGNNNRRLEHFTSGGLYGIESDVNNKYKSEIIQDELADLKNHLLQFNVSLQNFKQLSTDAANSV